MLKKNVLVTGIGGDIGQNVIKCLKSIEYNLDIIGCDVEFYAAGKTTCKKYYQSPYASKTERYLEFLQRLIIDDKINYIFPTTESEIGFFNNNRKYFQDDGLKIFIHDSNIINTFFDKYETVNFLKNSELPYPKTYLIEDYEGGLQFPVLLKPRKGYGSKGITIADNLEELEFYKKRKHGFVVQEIIGTIDEEYTVGVFSTGSEVYSIGFQRYLGYGSLTKFANLVHEEGIVSIIDQFAKACPFKGALNIQLRKGDRGFIPFEINARISSTVYFRHYFGFQDVKWWIDLKEGREVKYASQYRKGIAVRTNSEVFFDLER